jgi:hypothetical protein
VTVTPPGFEAPLELLELGDGDRVGVGAGAEAALGDMDRPALGTLGAGAEGLTERGAGDDWNPPLLVRTLGPGVGLGVGVGVVLGLTEVLGAWVGRELKLLAPGELNIGAGVLLTVCLGLL